jgi:hypothetical protein
MLFVGDTFSANNALCKLSSLYKSYCLHIILSTNHTLYKSYSLQIILSTNHTLYKNSTQSLSRAGSSFLQFPRRLLRTSRYSRLLSWLLYFAISNRLVA